MPFTDQKSTQKILKRATLALGLLLLSACQKASLEPNTQNLVDNKNPYVRSQIGDSTNHFQVLGDAALYADLRRGTVLSSSAPEAQAFLRELASRGGVSQRLQSPSGSASPTPAIPSDSLILGYPVSLVGEHQVFGAVITKVSDKHNQDLGMLKLTDLPPVHVTTVVAKIADNAYGLVLQGCTDNCTEASPQDPLAAFPISAVDTDKKLLLLDLAAIASDFNLIQKLDPKGDYTKLKTKTTRTTAVDYSFSTLVFDVETVMMPLDTSGEVIPPETVFTTRWYLKLGSAFNPAFLPRAATPGVGFFMTDRSAEPKILRHAVPGGVGASASVKYYVKNVPVEFRAGFKSAFDQWNEHFRAILGKDLLSYEFLDENDPRAALLVPGDIRYHIVEWDLVNKAPYGGLGPSVGNQFTGEIFSANVLIQGPTIIDMYKKWFAAKTAAEALRQLGNEAEADAVELRAHQELDQALEAKALPKLSLTLGKHLAFRVTSQLPSLEDPLMDRDDFDALPSGVTFEQYMAGYFHDMVAHELGHNLGLRHNFRGNLYSAALPKQGQVSTSVMEYLGRGYRYLDQIGPYDAMAMNYSYLGTKPGFTDRFCTDEEVPDGASPNLSAECSRDDASPDPFAFFEGRLARAIDLLVKKGSIETPTWTVKDMPTPLKVALNGMLFYALTAEKTAASWTNFFTGADRPKDAQGVKSYVLARLKLQLCDASLVLAVLTKPTTDAQQKTAANIKDLRTAATAFGTALKIYTAEELSCNQ